jgi:hypothetical protein
MTRGGPRPGLAVLALAAAACAVVAPPVSKLPDGSYRVACTEPLSSCLEAFETVCAWHGYDVISATERRRHAADLREVGNETIDSEAQVRCKPGEALFGGSPAAPAPPPAAPAPAASAPPQAAPLPAAATAEPPARAAFPTSCEAPAVDGGAPACGGTKAGTSGAANPR